jgi:hypothetical protein
MGGTPGGNPGLGGSVHWDDLPKDTEPPMSFRPLLILPVLALAACDMREQGPMETREGAFQYVAQMAPGTTLHLRTARGNITVEPSSDDTLRVIGDLAWRGGGEPSRNVTISGSVVPSGTLICAQWGGRRSTCTPDDYHAELNGSAGRTRVHFRVQVPSGVKLDLLGIDSDIVSASSAPVMARSVNGDVTIVTAVGPVRAETLNGDVDARMTTLAGTDSVIAKTLNGEAWAFLPEQASATVDVQVANGDVATDFGALFAASQRTKHLQGVLGTGTTPVLVKSLNGRAGLRKLDASGRAYELVPR